MAALLVQNLNLTKFDQCEAMNFIYIAFLRYFIKLHEFLSFFVILTSS